MIGASVADVAHLQQHFGHQYHGKCIRAEQLLAMLQDAEKAAKKLTDEAYGRGSNDNISCIVLRFNF